MKYLYILPQVRGDSQRFAEQRIQERSPKEHASNHPLLTLLDETEKLSTSPLKIEKVPAALAVAPERFWIIHSQSGLRIAGSFSQCEVKEFLKATKDWPDSYWEIDTATRRPACSHVLTRLLEQICCQPTEKAVKPEAHQQLCLVGTGGAR